MGFSLFRNLVCTWLALSVLGLSGCSQQDWYNSPAATETLDVSGTAKLNVRNPAGSVTVTGWDQNQISVTYTKRVNMWRLWWMPALAPESYFEQMTVTLAATADGADVTATLQPETWLNNIWTTIDLDIKIPQGGALNADLDAGNVTVTNVAGGATVVLDAGNAVLTGVSGGINMDVDAGNIDINHNDPLDNAETIECAVDAGNIDLWVPEGSSFQLDAGVDVGDMTVDSKFTGLEVERINLTSAQCQGTTGAGGATVTLHVNTGNIDVRAQ